jgi:hypothetical protein
MDLRRLKKCDALVSHGAHAIGLLGVRGWRGTNEKKGKTVLPDWHEIAIEGRNIRLAFDSDCVTNPDVEKALRGLARWLTSRGATVHAVYLPVPSHGKTGVDDFLLTHSLTELEGLLEEPRMTTRSRHQSANPHDRRPTIKVGTDVAPILDSLEDAIVRMPGPPRIYQWHKRLAVVSIDEDPPDWLRDSAGNAVVLDLSPYHLLEEASRAAKFERLICARARTSSVCHPHGRYEHSWSGRPGAFPIWQAW